jgi:hypothetical protein
MVLDAESIAEEGASTERDELAWLTIEGFTTKKYSREKKGDCPKRSRPNFSCRAMYEISWASRQNR